MSIVRRKDWTLRMLPLMLLLSGCVTPPLDNSKRLMERKDFPAAVKAAPEWAKDALKTINRLEYEIERK
jgi:hypothetical protein